jgi:hypothetical protein
VTGMTDRAMKQWIVTALLRLYPAAWRSEYGPELTDILMSRPLSARAIGDVMWNGLKQSAQAAEPSTILGLASLLAVLTFVVTGGNYGRRWILLVQPTTMTLPTVSVTFMASGYYALLLIGCGCWTYLRHRGKVSQSGMAGIRMSLIAAIPLMVGGLLMTFGFIGPSLLDPRFEASTSWAVLAAPLFRLPDSWLWAALGGQLGKWIVRRRPGAGAGVIRS